MKDLAAHVMDILQNSTRAGATEIEFVLAVQKKEDKIVLTFKDNGCGMDTETQEKVLNPFFTTRTTRKVGLGLPLLKQNAEMTGGSFIIDSQVNKGTEVVATFQLSHVDTKPMGDIPGTIVLTAAANPNIRFIFQYKTDSASYVFDTDEVNEALEGVSIQNPEIIAFLKEMIEENMKSLSS